jgi:hypothetical protein
LRLRLIYGGDLHDMLLVFAYTKWLVCRSASGSTRPRATLVVCNPVVVAVCSVEHAPYQDKGGTLWQRHHAPSSLM